MFELWKSSSEEFNNLFETGEFSDTEILVGEEPNTKVFKAHSLILKIRSPFFRSAFSSHWIRIENGIITLQKPNISVEVFDILLRYIYTSFIDLTIHDTRTNIALLIAADELCLNDLCVYIEGSLIDDEYSLKCNFVLIQKTVNQLSQFKRLLEFYELNVNMEPTLILRADDFITIQQENFLNFLIDHGQSLNPVEIWNKLIEWATEQSNELSSDTKKWTPDEITTFGTIIQPFIPYINFKGFSITDFCQKVKPFKSIFDNDLYVQILEHYSFNEDVHSKFKMKIDSKIINSCHAFLLGNLIKMAKQDNYNCLYDFKLLVRGSRDGFDIKSFHKCCDEKGPTITIASVKNTNEIVGGFSPLDWNSNYDANTRESFIFSLDKDKLTNFTFSKVIVGRHAIYKRRGPDFGENKSDLRLLEGDSNKKGQCYKNSYEKLIRCNEGEFEIDEYEVFQVINVNQVEEQIEMAPFRPFNPFINDIPISSPISSLENRWDF